MYNLNLIIDDEPMEIGRFTTEEKAKEAKKYSMKVMGYEEDELEIVKLNLDIDEMEIDGEKIKF